MRHNSTIYGIHVYLETKIPYSKGERVMDSMVGIGALTHEVEENAALGQSDLIALVRLRIYYGVTTT
jgi:hypothetical protein